MERICVKCSKCKDLEQFKKLHGEGYSGYCESCRGSARRSMRKIKTKEERTARHKEWRRENPKAAQYRDNRNLVVNHGITMEQFQEMSKLQNDVCAICQEPHKEESNFKRLHVDHDHITKQIRGLLCTNCNTALGLFKDDLERMKRAIRYLEGQLNTKLEIQR